MNDSTRDILISASVAAVGELAGIAVKALAGLYKSPEEHRAAMIEVTDRLADFVKDGGGMDQRRDAARKGLDDAIAAEEAKAGPNPTVLVSPEDIAPEPCEPCEKEAEPLPLPGVPDPDNVPC